MELKGKRNRDDEREEEKRSKNEKALFRKDRRNKKKIL